MARRSQRGSTRMASESSPMGIGLRVGIELVAALVVAVAIGYGLDWLFGTKPILTAAFVPVGGAAGVWNVWRVFAPKSGISGAGSRRGQDLAPVRASRGKPWRPKDTVASMH